MTLNSKMTSLADGFRNIYGTTDKYSIDDMTAFTGALMGTNLLKGTHKSAATLINSGMPQQAMTTTKNELLTIFNKYAGNYLTLSFYVDCPAFEPSDQHLAISMQISATKDDGSIIWPTVTKNISSSGFNGRVIGTFFVPRGHHKSISGVFNYYAYNPKVSSQITFSDMKLELGKKASPYCVAPSEIGGGN